MKRLTLLALGLLCACSSQRRPDYAEPDYSYVPDARGEDRPADPVERLLENARRHAEAREFDEARISLHQVFRRDRWHPDANTLYQDVELKRGKGAALYQEYLDLFAANQSRGDALWFHLRPLLVRRGFGAYAVESQPHQAPDETERIEALLFVSNPESDESLRARRESLRVLLKLPLTAQQGWRLVGRWFSMGNERAGDEELLKHWQEASEEHPGSGDAVALLARTLMQQEPPRLAEALNSAREAWILELPSALLPLALGQVALAQFEGLDGLERESARSRQGFALVAWHFFKLALATEPANHEAEQGLAMLASKRGSSSGMFEDLTTR